jgi:hypothetical protein
MSNRVNILQELNDLNSSLAGNNPENVYTVPEGYFNGLANQVLNRIKAFETDDAKDELSYLSPLVSSLSKEMLFDVPAGYFDGLEERMMHSVRESGNYRTAKEEIAALSPFLSGLKKEMPYSIPQGYFDELQIQPAKSQTPAAKVVSITSRNWFRVAAAAVVTGIIFVTALLIIRSDEVDAERVLAKVERDVKKMDETQKADVIDFIDAGMTGTESANNNNKSYEVRQLLEGVSDEELKDFQEQTEDIADVLMIN